MYQVIAKKCSKCGLLILLSNFTNNKKYKFGKSSRCKFCDKICREKCKTKEKWITLWKPCSACGKIKFTSDFYTDDRAIDGLWSKCKMCWSDTHKNYRDTHADEIKSYRESKSDTHKEYMHNYYQKNKNVYAKENRLYRETHKDNMCEYKKRYRLSHPDKIRAIAAKRRELGYDPSNICEYGFHGHHLYLDDKQDLVIYMPAFLHTLYGHNHNVSETMITPNALALDFMIHEELYRIIYYEDITPDTFAIEALDSGIITFAELSDMMYKSRKESNKMLTDNVNTTSPAIS